MDIAQEMQRQTRENDVSSRHEVSNATITNQLKFFSIKDYAWWFRVSLYIIFLFTGESAATLLGRLYYDKGGNSEWMATFVQSAGFPILIPLTFFFRGSKKSAAANPSSTNRSPQTPSVCTLVLLYLFFGLLLTGDNLMYSYGLLYVPLSTYSLLRATQLASSALFSFLLNSRKFIALIVNSVVLLTISASLLAIHSNSDDTTKVSKAKYTIGFLCTLGASATYSLYLSVRTIF